MKAIILAAGYAMRLYPLTENTPKALLPIGGRVMLDYLMDSIAGIASIDEAVIVSNHRFAAQFAAWAQQAAQRYANLKLSVLDDGTVCNEDRLGAVGDIAFAIREAAIDDDVLVAASDNFFTFDLNDFVNDFRTHGQNLLLAQPLKSLEELRRFAVAEMDDRRRVISLVEKPENPTTDLGIFALYLYRRDVLPLFGEYLAEGNNPDSPGRFPEWLCTRRETRAYVFEGECVDIGTHESYREICARYSEQNS